MSFAIKPTYMPHDRIAQRQVHHSEMKPLSKEAAQNLNPALEFASVKGLGKLQFYFKGLQLSCSGAVLPEFLGQHTKLNSLQKLAVVLTLFDQLQKGERPLPKTPGQPINIDGPINRLIDPKKTAQARTRLELASKKKDPMLILKPSSNRPPAINPNAYAHKSFSDHFRHNKTNKAETVKSSIQEEVRPETTVVQLDKLMEPLLRGLVKNPERVAKEGNEQRKLLFGVS